ncbi:MAG: DUF1553 domain-containing protein [Rubripirellula sp.]|nr:DUF1553 domain-containing protein [Rubripirellula sp.]
MNLFKYLFDRRIRQRFGVSLAVCLVMASPGLGSADAEDLVDFNREIRPLLSNHCLICHGPDEAERAAGLRLDSLAGATADLGGYAAIAPGDPEESELFVRITSDDPDLQMPPPGKGKPLSEPEIALLKRWVEQGAPYAKHWSYVKPERPKLPTVNDPSWVANPIDHFVLAKLDSLGLQPSPEADRLTLARRLSLDLTGLPPTWQEAKDFESDTRDNAYELYVDRLLDKQSYGERWARVWLDLARYADSAGYADDPPRTIWAYRDYVIRSLNANKPFDQFTIEQIAGDLLGDPTDEQLIATAFHRNTLTNNEGGTNNEEFRNVAIVDRVNTTMAVWMGTTMACAQCHTHKYDPITQDEYFQFFAFFNQSEDSDQRDERPLLEVWSEEQRTQQKSLQLEIKALQQKLTQERPEIDADRVDWLAGFDEQPTWRPLFAEAVEAEQRSLVIGEEGWIDASGELPQTDRYQVRYPIETQSITGIRLEVPAEQTDNFVVSSISAVWEPRDSQSTEARYVRVDLPGENKMIHLAEIEVYSGGKNVALDGTPSQSTTDFGGEVKYINDGNTDGNYNGGSVTHTASQKDPWIEIDLGKSVPVERLAVWNRTDGGATIAKRLQGYQIRLLDEDRETVWQQQPESVPSPGVDWSPDGTIEIPLHLAVADHEQQGFPAQSVLAAQPNPKQGWAVSPLQGQPHELTLLLTKPRELKDGILKVRVDHSSIHPRHVLNRFRFSITSDQSASKWVALPADVVAAIRQPERTPAQQSRLVEYHRSVTPILAATREQLKKSQQQLASVKAMTTVPVMRELPAERRRQTRVQIRGNYQATGDEVTEGTPAVFHPLPDEGPRGRLALAKWLVDEQNPLTARVIANRHWEQVFGKGLVVTSEEFGSQGELPSHPQLLDWLAVELRESGWDLKRFLKLLVTSSTYRQASVTTPELQEADPFNRFFARGARFRVSAEMVRDQALFVSGLLSEKMYGKPVNPPQPQLGLKAAFGSATDWKTSSGDDRYRRGIYTSWRRSSPYPSMAQFDAPNREVCTVRRIRTNTPLQALVTLNDPVYVEAAQSLAKRVVDHHDDVNERIRFAFQTCLLREPTEAEQQRVASLVARVTKQYLSETEEAAAMATQAGNPSPGDADVVELATWTVISNVMLNLDETFLKR